MITRAIKQELIDCSNEYPIVTIVGPRQSGKTTLVKSTFTNHEYFSMENPDILDYANYDPRAFLSKDKMIIDEVQRAPFLLSYLQGIVDSGVKPGSFILTGSHQPLLAESISQTLAGRTSVLKLLPFSFNEISSFSLKLSPFEKILRGGYPALYDKNLKLNRFFNAYVRTYVERDVRQMINIKDLRSFQQLLRLSAGRVGNISNYSSLSNDIGISSTTIKEWISVLDSSYLIYELQPYFENIRKRVVKSKKLYFFDTGLVCYLLGISDENQLERDPLRGNIFENAIIMDIIKNFEIIPDDRQLYFFRDSNGNEVDLLISKGRKLIPVEIKSASTFNSKFLKGIKSFRKLKTNCDKAYVLYLGDKIVKCDDITIINPFIHHKEYNNIIS